ncbi:MAG: response regulator [Rhodopila sp.]|jgi:CheY-like chemotaxis protein
MKPGTILLVDDEEINRDIIGAFIRHTGRGVRLASGGAQAVVLAGAQRFDMILMDIRMPAGISGLEAARIIRASPGPCQYGLILALTVIDTAEKRTACMAAGMDGSIVKPISYEALSAALDQWSLGGHEPDEPAA